MIFDRLCAMAEAWQLPIRALLEHAYLIQTDLIPHEVLARHLPLERLSGIARDFRLPHGITAVEDAASCIVLGDLEEDAAGLAMDRLFVECLPCDPLISPRPYGDPLDLRLDIQEACSAMPAGAVMISIGRFSSPAQREGSFAVLGELGLMLIGTPQRLVFTPDQYQALPDHQVLSLLSSALKNAMTAVEELIHIAGQPSFGRWPSPQAHRPLGRIRRSSERCIIRVHDDGLIEHILAGV